MESYDGTLWAEPNPVPDDLDLPFRLPTVELPEDVNTIPTTSPLASSATAPVEA
jgi:lysine 2,3-aminomutase